MASTLWGCTQLRLLSQIAVRRGIFPDDLFDKTTCLVLDRLPELREAIDSAWNILTPDIALGAIPHLDVTVNGDIRVFWTVDTSLLSVEEALNLAFREAANSTAVAESRDEPSADISEKNTPIVDQDVNQVPFRPAPRLRRSSSSLNATARPRPSAKNTLTKSKPAPAKGSPLREITPNNPRRSNRSPVKRDVCNTNLDNEGRMSVEEFMSALDRREAERLRLPAGKKRKLVIQDDESEDENFVVMVQSDGEDEDEMDMDEPPF